jgi:hypothetical protein
MFRILGDTAMSRIYRKESDYQQLIKKYHEKSHTLTTREFCRQEEVSFSAFYRKLNDYKSKNQAGVKDPAPKFIELKQPQSRQGILVKFFGFKILSLELEYV